MKINSEELGEYVRAVLEGISKGVSEEIRDETFSLSAPVKFQVNVTSSFEGKGEVKLFVAVLHGGKSSEQSARIEFEVSNQDNILEAVDKAVSIYAKLPEKDQNSLKSLIRAAIQGSGNQG